MAPDRAALERQIARATGARVVELGERVQRLWGGYGEIRRATLVAPSTAPVIVKHAVPPSSRALTGAEARSHRRKLRSYRVECAFYRVYAPRCDARCRVPAALHAAVDGDRMLLVLEDLDAAGFGLRREDVSEGELQACLRWLAEFHATFLDTQPDLLWNVGTYWHLTTRTDELRALSDPVLRRAAPVLDEQLNRARYRTLVHGDAKLPNFCFTDGGSAVAAVDFQYVGGGVGVKDVAYFLTSCRSPTQLERDAESYVDAYFRELRRALQARAAERADWSGQAGWDLGALEAEWRALYPLACADFYRFLLGWAGGVDARDSYLERVTGGVLARF
jgi:aminoglycoside phosphotransferase (APT) family kinase protein